MWTRKQAFFLPVSDWITKFSSPDSVKGAKYVFTGCVCIKSTRTRYIEDLPLPLLLALLVALLVIKGPRPRKTAFAHRGCGERKSAHEPTVDDSPAAGWSGQPRNFQIAKWSVFFRNHWQISIDSQCNRWKVFHWKSFIIFYTKYLVNYRNVFKLWLWRTLKVLFLLVEQGPKEAWIMARRADEARMTGY